ncbi:MAG TPA: inorganic phosphate transporter [Candidatus Limnocylindria bacterium]|nr:inorganic phosphate transporter [Candidatus Limnocylindria bacterium]
MTVSIGLVLIVGAVLAYANGSNDVSKGIATLVGSGVTDYRRAIAWGTAWTAVGGLLGAVLAGAMLSTFGTGLLSPGTTPTYAGALAALIGAGGWVLVATWKGLPVSTTHAIIGSLVGVATLAYGTEAVRWSSLGGKVVLPLLASPIISLVITTVLLRVTGRRNFAEASTDCLCAQVEPPMVAVGASTQSAALLSQPPHLRIITGSTEACAKSQPTALRLTLDHLHWLTSGATSLARGMNDGPKMVALVAAASVLLGGAGVSTPTMFGLVTVAMVVGSFVAGRRVTHLLAEKVTAIDHREGFAANLVTAGLVIAGAVYGLPMSTTHVSSGGIFNAGALRGSLNRKTLRDILLAWAVTLPAAAAIGMVAYALMRLAEAKAHPISLDAGLG